MRFATAGRILSIVAGVAAVLTLLPADAEAAKCRCRIHAAEALGDGICARTENRRHCSLVFSSARTEFPETFVRFLKSSGVLVDPTEAVRFARSNRPEGWTTEQMKKYLPALFAMPMHPEFTELVELIANTFDSMGSRSNLDAFRTHKNISSAGMLGRFATIISLGCIELYNQTLTMMVKLPESRAGRSCDDLP